MATLFRNIVIIYIYLYIHTYTYKNAFFFYFVAGGTYSSSCALVLRRVTLPWYRLTVCAACNKHSRRPVWYYCVKAPTEKCYPEVVSLEYGVILRHHIGSSGVKVWRGFNWLRIWPSGRLYWTR